MSKIVLNMSKPKAYKYIIEQYKIPNKLWNKLKWDITQTGRFEMYNKVFVVNERGNRCS